jgi:hypothetical protein
MNTKQIFTLLAVAMLILLAGNAQTVPTTAASQASIPTLWPPGDAEVATAPQSGVSNDLVLASPGQPHSYDNPYAADVGALKDLGPSSLVTPALLDGDSALPTNELLPFDAINSDHDGESSGELSLPLSLNERVFQELEFNGDGAVTLDEWQQFDTSAGAKDHFGVLDENADGLINVAEFLTQAPKHPGLYRLFWDADKTNDSDFSWDREEFQPRALQLFSIHF